MLSCELPRKRLNLLGDVNSPDLRCELAGPACLINSSQGDVLSEAISELFSGKRERGLNESEKTEEG